MNYLTPAHCPICSQLPGDVRVVHIYHLTDAQCKRRSGFPLLQIDLTQPLAPQGPFDVIVHKLSDVIMEAEHDSKSQQLLANFQVRHICCRCTGGIVFIIYCYTVCNKSK